MAKFKDTKFGTFLSKAGDVLKDKGGTIAGIAIKAATGNISGAMSDVSTMLSGESSPEAKALLNEFNMKMKEFELEMYKVEVEDRGSARDREVEVLKAGGDDIMMKVTGGVGLLSFILIVVSILFMDLPEANMKLIYHLVGMVEGVSLTIFAYYYGTSKSSKDKTGIIDKLKKD